MLAKWSIHIFLIFIVHQQNSNLNIKGLLGIGSSICGQNKFKTFSNPILRTYCNMKCNFGMETYLDAIKNYKYRVAMSQLRTSSHTLAIKYGRYTRPKTKIEDRKCSSCHILEDERHFLIECNINQTERVKLILKTDTHSSKFHSYDWWRKIHFPYVQQRPTNTYLGW